MSNFKPAFGLANKHVQTIYSTLFRKVPKIDFDIETFYFSDGDSTECYWLKTTNHDADTPIVVLFHGLAGSYNSPYIQGAMRQLANNSFNVVLMHFRGCAGDDNLLPRSYHSGDSGDALELLNSLKQRYPNSKLYAVGYSLGANMLLKLLGEQKNDSPLDKAIAISAPMQLDICANKMNQGFSRFYQKRLIKDLNAALTKKYNKHDMQNIIGLQRKEIKKIKTFWNFDGVYTAPVHGFSSAQDYYERCSCRQFLKYIDTPTLIIHSLDDPFMSPDVLPAQADISDKIRLKVSKKGGHVGFIGGTIFKPEYWLEEQIIKFFV